MTETDRARYKQQTVGAPAHPLHYNSIARGMYVRTYSLNHSRSHGFLPSKQAFIVAMHKFRVPDSGHHCPLTHEEVTLQLMKLFA